MVRDKRSGTAFAREICRELAVLALVAFEDLAHLCAVVETIQPFSTKTKKIVKLDKKSEIEETQLVELIVFVYLPLDRTIGGGRSG